MSKSIILTGIRSNEEPTIGNYIGAIAPIINMAVQHGDKYQINLFVPDLHSFTTPIDHSTLYRNTLRNLQLFAACGLPLDNPDVHIYRQSFIPAHSELAWLLSCFTGYGEAARMTEFKDKMKTVDGQNGESTSVGLFNYPILMAADILLYGAEWVPVGEDQRQHLELCRDLATRLNNRFGDLFVVPHALKEQQAFINRDSAPRIRSLKNPDKKMSKSVADGGSILLSHTPEEASKIIMSATTDSLASIAFDWENQPGITNLLTIESSLSGVPIEEVTKQWSGNSHYGELKATVAKTVGETLAKIHAASEALEEQQLLDKLASSEELMRQSTAERLEAVQRALGLRK